MPLDAVRLPRCVCFSVTELQKYPNSILAFRCPNKHKDVLQYLRSPSNCVCSFAFRTALFYGTDTAASLHSVVAVRFRGFSLTSEMYTYTYTRNSNLTVAEVLVQADDNKEDDKLADGIQDSESECATSETDGTASDAPQATTSASEAIHSISKATEILGCSPTNWRKKMKDWVMHWQAILQVQNLSWQERARIATQHNMEGFLEFTRTQILDDEEPPSALSSLHQHLQEMRELRVLNAKNGVEAATADALSDGNGDNHHQDSEMEGASEGAGPFEKDKEGKNNVWGEDWHVPGDVFDVLTENCSGQEFAGQVFMQLMRVIAQEMGCRVASLDRMMLEFEHSCKVA